MIVTMQRCSADAELSSDVPKCTTCPQSLIYGRVLGMGTDSARSSHLSRNDSMMPRKTLAPTCLVNNALGPDEHYPQIAVSPVTLRAFELNHLPTLI
jgi:hypothetical protein